MHSELRQLTTRAEMLPVCWRNGRWIEKPMPAVVMPGSFNPLHAGHRKMAAIATAELGAPVEFELALRNVDKGEISDRDLAERLQGFAAEQIVWLTTAATFREKAACFPNAVFVVGADTIARIGDPKYYRSVKERDDAIESITDCGCRFLVFGRQQGDTFRELAEIDLPPGLATLSQGIPASRFRLDISSSDLRRTRPGTRESSE